MKADHQFKFVTDSHSRFYPEGKPHAPHLTVSLRSSASGKRKTVTNWALLDTGASICAISVNIANSLGIVLKASPDHQIITASGSVDAWKCDIEVNFPFYEKDYFDIRPFNVIKGLNNCILGQKGFLEHTIVTFNYLEYTGRIRM